MYRGYMRRLRGFTRSTERASGVAYGDWYNYGYMRRLSGFTKSKEHPSSNSCPLPRPLKVSKSRVPILDSKIPMV